MNMLRFISLIAAFSQRDHPFGMASYGQRFGFGRTNALVFKQLAYHSTP
jgi:hypothetical protein